jgi:hypothetical protein
MTADQVMAYAKEKYTIILEKVLQHNKLLDNYLRTLNSFDSKLDTILQLLEQKNVIGENDFEELHDHNTGWRKKTETELAADGDVVWVNYKLTSDEIKAKVPAGFVEEKDMPIRLGAKAVIFEESIVGKKVGEAYNYTHKDDKDTFEFVITVSKLKTRLEGVSNGEPTEAGNGSDSDVASTTESNI